MTQVSTAVGLRLTAAQMAILWPGINLLVSSYAARQRPGGIRYEYPFRIYPPGAEFDPGRFHPEMMDKVLNMGKTLRNKRASGGRVQWDTFHLRAAVFAVRAYGDFMRYRRYQNRRLSPREKIRLGIDDDSVQRLKDKSKPLIRFLERHMKRANRVLGKAVTGDQYHDLMAGWTGHLHWMRLHIAYFKPLIKPLPGRRIRQQRILYELMRMAERGLHNEGFQPPEGRELRRIMRLFARSARRGREGIFDLPYLLKYPQNFNNTRYLALFVLGRLTLPTLHKS